jgi:hypothetical protein
VNEDNLGLGDKNGHSLAPEAKASENFRGSKTPNVILALHREKTLKEPTDLTSIYINQVIQ